MKGRVLGSLFALPFFAVGVWMLWSISSTFLKAWDTSDWQSLEATLITAGYNIKRGSDSDTYEVYATYNFTFRGARFQGDRVNFQSGSDNVGLYHQKMGRRLSSALERGEPIAVLVNPTNPSDSVIDASIRWGMIGFRSLFLFLFGGFGLGLLIYIWRAPQEKDETLPEFQESPWLLNQDWQTATIRSSSKTAMWGAWAIAVVWCLISSPMPFVAYREIAEKQNYLALAALLFPVIGVGLVVWALAKTREWHRFGATPVHLDPFPGSIGGHVGGTIDINMPFRSANNFLLTLSNIHSYVSGSGDNRGRKESVLWQDEIVAHTDMSRNGTRLSFRFDVPTERKESAVRQSGDSYHLWRLNLRADIPGTNLDRDFEIPVFATAQDSVQVSEHRTSASKRDSNAVYDNAIRDMLKLNRVGSRIELIYPMGHNAWSNLAGMLVGSVFAAIGAYMYIVEDSWLFGVSFGGMGSLVTIMAFYMLFKSLVVSLDRGTITSVRRLLGIPISQKQIPRKDFHNFETTSAVRSRSGTTSRKLYKVNAVDHRGNRILIGEGFEGTSQVDAAKRLFSSTLGLSVKA